MFIVHLCLCFIRGNYFGFSSLIVTWHHVIAEQASRQEGSWPVSSALLCSKYCPDLGEVGQHQRVRRTNDKESCVFLAVLYSGEGFKNTALNPDSEGNTFSFCCLFCGEIEHPCLVKKPWLCNVQASIPVIPGHFDLDHVLVLYVNFHSKVADFQTC